MTDPTEPIFPPAPEPELPEAASPSPESTVTVASLGRRAVAYLIDAVIMVAILVAVALVVGIVAAIANGGHVHASVRVDSNSSGKELVTAALVFGLTSLVPLAYLWKTTSRAGLRRGQTVGQGGQGLRIVNVDGSEITAATARDRALAFVIPGTTAFVVGPLLDAAFSTPPLFTNIFFIAASAYSLADFYIAPLVGDDRRTLHDRIAGTVVIGPEVAAPPVPTPVGRPKTGLTWFYGTLGTVGMVALIVINVALIGSSSGSSDSGDVSSADSGAQAGIGQVTEDQLARSPDIGEAGATRTATVLGTQFAKCLTMVTAIDDCKENSDLGLPDGAITVTSISEPPSGTSNLAGQIALTDGSAWGHPDDRFVGIYDRSGYLWGYIFEPDGSFGPACRNIRGHDCSAKSSNPVGHAFMNDEAAIKAISAAAGG